MAERLSDMEDKTGLFREKNLRKASGPEQLDKYLKVTGVSSWVIVITGALTVVFLLIWASLGKLDNVIQGAAQCSDGVLTCYFRTEDIDDIREGMNVQVDEKTFVITRIDPQYYLAEDLPREILYLSPRSDWHCPCR